MLTSKLMLCAQGVIMDAQTRAISVFNILEEITPSGLPAFLPQMGVLIMLERLSDDSPILQTRLSIILGAEILFEQSFDVNFQDKLRHRQIVSFGGLAIPQPGTLKVQFSQGDNVLDEYSIIVQAPPVSVQPVLPTM